MSSLAAGRATLGAACCTLVACSRLPVDGAHVTRCPETRAWRNIEYLSASPGVRENNGVVEHDRSLYLFGGYNGSEWLNDFWQFNLGA